MKYTEAEVRAKAAELCATWVREQLPAFLRNNFDVVDSDNPHGKHCDGHNLLDAFADYDVELVNFYMEQK